MYSVFILSRRAVTRTFQRLCVYALITVIHWKLRRKGVSYRRLFQNVARCQCELMNFTIYCDLHDCWTLSRHLPSHGDIIVVVCCTDLKHLTPSKSWNGAKTLITRPQYMLVSVVIWLRSLLCWQTRWSSAFAVGKALKPSNATSSYRHSCECYGCWGHILTLLSLKPWVRLHYWSFQVEMTLIVWCRHIHFVCVGTVHLFSCIYWQ